MAVDWTAFYWMGHPEEFQVEAEVDYVNAMVDVEEALMRMEGTMH